MDKSIHNILLRYFNTACFSKSDMFLSLITPKITFQKNAGLVLEKYASYQAEKKEASIEKESISVSPYNGNNAFVLKMMDLFRIYLLEDFIGVYVHGSLASQDSIFYSDFDALLIVKDSVFRSKKQLCRVANKLNEIQRIMHQFDPLQHHGWFILTEAMLRNYPLTYFPPILFQESNSIFQEQGLKFEINYNSKSADYVAPFHQVANSLLYKLKSGYKPKNVFQLKSILSEFMLLPALYWQAKHHKGILKKDSFKLSQQDFDDSEWQIMDRVSLIRKNWFYDISNFQRKLLQHKNFMIRKFSRRYAPSIPAKLESQLTQEFYSSMVSLVNLMKEKIASNN